MTLVSGSIPVRSLNKFFPVCLLVLHLLAQPTMAQTNGSISGVVVDPSGSVVPGAQLELTHVATARTQHGGSGADGYFTFTDLPTGRYSLRIMAEGFRELDLDGLNLTVGQQMTVRPELTLGQLTDIVEVSSTPPPVTTSSSTVSHLVDSQRIDRLPLNGRNALQLVALVPGVVEKGRYGQFGATQLSFEVAGGRQVDMNFNLDGGINMNAFYNNANDYPNPDALQEFTVNTRTYTAAFGRGFNQVSAVTKSGTNEIHGSLFEFLRNTKLDARSFFAPQRSEFKRNQYGGTVGGPVVRNKTFFFGGFQGTKERGTPGVNRYRTLTTAERQGAFSTPVSDPQTGASFANNQIPASRIQPFATKFIDGNLPAANSGNDFFTFTPGFKLDQTQLIGKLDHNFSDNDRISFRYLLNDTPQLGNGVSAFLDSSWLAELPTRSQNFNLSWHHVFTPSLISEVRLTHVRNAYGVRTPRDFSLSGLGLDVNVANAISDFGLTPDSRISVGGFFSASPGVPTRDIVPTSQLTAATTWIHGKHKVGFGVEIYKNRVNQLQNFLTGGTIGFNGFASGNAAADFLLGEYNSYRQITPLVTRLRQTIPASYVQDDIRVHRNVTVNLGVRWEPFVAWVSENDVLSTFRPGVQSTAFPKMAPGLLYPGDDGLPRTITGSQWKNFAPRVGIAWDVRGDGKTSIRAGYGIYLMPTFRGIYFNRFPLIQPFALDVRLFGGSTTNLWAAEPFNGVNPYPRPDVTDIAGLRDVAFTPTAGHTSFALPFKTQSDNQWSFSIQQALRQDTVLEVAYVGSSASHLYTSSELNPAVYIPGQSTVANTQQRRLYPQFGPINDTRASLSSNYNSLQVSLTKRYSKGFSVLGSYAWSKGLGVNGSFGEGSNGQRNPFNSLLDYGRQPGDVRQNFVTSFIWESPLSGHSNGIVRRLFGAWQLNGINTLRTGLPFTCRSGLDNSLVGIGGDTCDQVGEWKIEGDRSRGEMINGYFNTEAFTQNAIGTFGHSGINALEGPGFWNFDLGITRLFPVAEGKHFEFRALAYNVLNRPNFGLPNSTRSSPVFGRITATSHDGRVVEFGLKFIF